MFWRIVLSTVLLANVLPCAHTQEAPIQEAPQQITQPAFPQNALPTSPLDDTAVNKSPLFREMDALRRQSFTASTQARVGVRVYEHGSNKTIARRLPADAFIVTVNGTERSARLEPPSHAPEATPLVMLTFPPNQRFLHHLGLKDAKLYFEHQGGEVLPWKVAILDSDGMSTPFTNGKAQVLAYLETIEHKTEPFIVGGGAYVGAGTMMASPDLWLSRATLAISAMQTSAAPRIILAFSPMPQTPDEGRDIFATEGPEFLIPMARRVGAHIYTAKIGGPNPVYTEYMIQGAAQATHIPLPQTQNTAEPASVEVHLQGPGLRKSWSATRTITLEPQPPPNHPRTQPTAQPTP